MYVNEGLAVLAELTLPRDNFSRNLRTQYLRSLTSALPKLDPALKKVQSRGSWKQKRHPKKINRKKALKGVRRVWALVSRAWPDLEQPLYTLAGVFVWAWLTGPRGVRR